MKSIKLTCTLLLSLLLLVMAAPLGKAEPGYTVSKSELTAMKRYIAIIKQEKENLLKDLQSCKISLQQAEERRQSLESQLTELIYKHKMLSEERSELEMLLKDLRESFAQLKKEAETKIRRLTIQRNLVLIAGIIVAFL